MPRRSPVALDRIVERAARLSPPRHRELVRGMVAELDSIADPAERLRFALGAITAIARLTLSGFGRAAVHLPDRVFGAPDGGPNPGGPTMSLPTTRTLLRRHIAPFVISLTVLTVLLLARLAMRQLAQLAEAGAPLGTFVEVVLLSVPFTIALTIPMAVFLAVSWVFARLGTEGVLAQARQEPNGVRRLMAPVLAVSAVIGIMTFVSNTQIVPRANERFVTVVTGAPSAASDRTMTIRELRQAAQNARTTSGAEGAARAAAYEVEIQKKFALPVACVLLALAGAAMAFRFPNGGRGLVVGASAVVFIGYFVALVAGESLADSQMIPPFVAMWTANAVLFAVALLLMWRRRRPSHGVESLAIGG